MKLAYNFLFDFTIAPANTTGLPLAMLCVVSITELLSESLWLLQHEEKGQHYLQNLELLFQRMVSISMGSSLPDLGSWLTPFVETAFLSNEKEVVKLCFVS